MFRKTLVATLATLALGATAQAQSLSGRWDATMNLKGTEIPFRLQIAPTKDGVRGTLYDGDLPANPSTRGAFQNGALHLDFDSYATKLDATYDGSALHGTIGNLPFEAHPHHAQPVAAKAPNIAGVWEIPVDSPKGERAWRLIVKQKGSEAYAAILRIDGDTGTLNGPYDGTKFRLSRYAGERPGLLEVTPQKDGSLTVAFYDQGGRHDYTAIRTALARKQGLPAPTEPTKQTSVKEPKEKFQFAGVDLAGKPVSQADPRFKGKVVLVNIMGSWCPNCHDEAPFLAQLDAEYRDKGLRIVGLDFEQPDQLKTLDRLKAFIVRYGLKYTVLVGGERNEVNAKLPQAVNLNAWPTTFFLSRDGRVHSVHVGFPSPGSGPYDLKARADISHEIEALLAERS
jgi:thiol-disulfide isomerase/thioredoxin